MIFLPPSSHQQRSTSTISSNSPQQHHPVPSTTSTKASGKTPSPSGLAMESTLTLPLVENDTSSPSDEPPSLHSRTSLSTANLLYTDFSTTPCLILKYLLVFCTRPCLIFFFPISAPTDSPSTSYYCLQCFIHQYYYYNFRIYAPVSTFIHNPIFNFTPASSIIHQYLSFIVLFNCNQLLLLFLVLSTNTFISIFIYCYYAPLFHSCYNNFSGFILLPWHYAPSGIMHQYNLYQYLFTGIMLQCFIHAITISQVLCSCPWYYAPSGIMHQYNLFQYFFTGIMLQPSFLLL